MQLFFIILPVIAIDQISKHIITKCMIEGASIPIINGFFHLTFIYNKGAAFGVLENQQWLFIAIAFLLIILSYFFRKQINASDSYLRYGISTLLGGAIGNLIDRICLNKVVDFFDFIIWPVFNIADIAICVGVGMILWSIFQTDVLNNQ